MHSMFVMREFVLNDGHLIPKIGFGTYKLPADSHGKEALSYALNAGYRLIDCAEAYDNESMVGECLGEAFLGNALKYDGSEGPLSRDDLFITGKVWKSHLGYDSTLRAFEKSLENLKLDYLNLYLIHWPAVESQTADWKSINRDTWRALERLVDEGAAASIGVSNFQPAHLQPLLETANIPPAVNQVEYNPGFQQKECMDFCKKHDILVQAWSPLARGRIFDSPVLRAIALRHGKSVAQICLRWEVQMDTCPIPKSTSPERISQNADIFDFELSDEEMHEIVSLHTFGNSGLDPDTFDR